MARISDVAVAATDVAIDELRRAICAGAHDVAYVAPDKHDAVFAVLVRGVGTRGTRMLLIETLALNVDMLRIVTRSKLAYVQQRLGNTIEIRIHISGAEAALPAS